ncbi:tetratricopeptide repeat protein [Flavobacterium sp.]|uniref:tetratricopeptide repeat protein n=1 Tax=Flavobacterium sp. TaxID=239 RepID=UPI002FDABCC7
MKTKKSFSLFFLGLLFQASMLWAQQEPEDIALENDAFQISFYESLREKGIENYDKAVLALQKCVQLQPNNPVVYFELGKNYYYQKDYSNALLNFQKATQLDPKNRWFWVGVYDVYYATKEYPNAIKTLTQLIEFRKEYKEDLVSLFMFTGQLDNALKLIEELNSTIGKSEMREQYRSQILASGKYQNIESDKLLESLKNNPKDEAVYEALIAYYLKQNQQEKAFELTQKMEKELPESDWAQVSLFKFYLDQKQQQKLLESLHKSLSSPKIDIKIKHRIFNEFLIYAKNKEELVPEVEKAISHFKNERDIQVAKEVGKFYQMKLDWIQAAHYYEMANQNYPDDFEIHFLLSEALLQSKQWDKLKRFSWDNIEKYPLQPEFYYYAAKVAYEIKDYPKAQKTLETGIDYIVNSEELERQFYLLLADTYKSLGDNQKANLYVNKAQKIKK